jgi:hypothetical protein
MIYFSRVKNKGEKNGSEQYDVVRRIEGDRAIIIQNFILFPEVNLFSLEKFAQY